MDRHGMTVRLDTPASTSLQLGGRIGSEKRAIGYEPYSVRGKELPTKPNQRFAFGLQSTGTGVTYAGTTRSDLDLHRQ